MILRISYDRMPTNVHQHYTIAANEILTVVVHDVILRLYFGAHLAFTALFPKVVVV